MTPRLMRSEKERLLSGVCGGLAIYLGVDPVLVRLAFLLLLPAGGIGLPLYLALMIMMPSEVTVGRPQGEIIEKNLENLGETMNDSVERLRQHPNGPTITAILLILLGAYFLAGNLGWFSLSFFWPFILILLGIALIIRRK